MEAETEKVEFEGEHDREKEAESVIKEQAAETTVSAAEPKQTAETISAATTSQAVVTELTQAEIEVAEMLVKAKNDTPKTKGVVINEGGAKKIEKKGVATDVKKKGKEKMIESHQPSKQQKMIESDEALAKKMQEELDQAEKEQVEKDREIARALANELNEAFQKGLETEKAKQRAMSLRKAMMVRTSAKKRRPSQTYLATQERNKMITFLRSAIGVKKEMFVKMSFDQIKDLYEKEMGKLKSNEKDRVEFEKKAKKRHDININQPFPESEEGTLTKGKEEKREEKKKEATTGQGQRNLKRTKMMSKRKKIVKKPRIDSEEGAEKVAEEEEAPESSTMKEPASTDDVKMYMVVMDKVPEPISAEPVGVKPPEEINWDILEVDGKEYIRLKRSDEKYEVYATWNKIVRTCSRSDLEEMFEIGMRLYADQLKAPEVSINKLAMEYMCMMFKPEEEMLKLHEMLKKKLGCVPDSEVAKYLIKRIINQSLGLNPNTGV
ncbi:hypothetical protein L6452_37056 [Arctium lappa]|uniref:Uncharacterized protein n=1 Tax=Arctium lappa TaxID=4217 RepID=A0ACB8Y1A9_ARCLA|nr:hypothetical protein L6452_37056 [Arctium lappa]